MERIGRRQVTEATLLSSGGVPLRLRKSLLKGDRNMSPNLNREDDRRRQQQRSNGYVCHGRDDHRQLRLNRVAAPGYASEKCCESQTQLSNDQGEHYDGRTAYCLNLGIDCQRPNRSPSQDKRDDDSMHHVRPPAKPVVAEHRSQNQLHVEHKNREQAKGKQTGPPLVELHARLFLYPFPAREYSHRHCNTKECLSQCSMRR